MSAANPFVSGEPIECSCPTNEAGDIRCHDCGERVNVKCWKCGTVRGHGRCPEKITTLGFEGRSSELVPKGQFILIDPDPIRRGRNRKFSEAELIVRDMCADVFGKEWLKAIGAWTYSTGELLEIMRDAK